MQAQDTQICPLSLSSDTPARVAWLESKPSNYFNKEKNIVGPSCMKLMALAKVEWEDKRSV